MPKVRDRNYRIQNRDESTELLNHYGKVEEGRKKERLPK